MSSANRARLLQLMARHAQKTVGETAAELGQLAALQAQQNDLKTRIDHLLQGAMPPGPGGPATVGQLASAHISGQVLVHQLGQLHDGMAQAQAQADTLRQALARASQRQHVLHERAGMARVAAAVEAQERAEALHPMRRKS